MENCLESSVTLSWTKPADDGGCPVVRYMIEQASALKQDWTFLCSTPSCEATIEGLSNQQVYFFRVAAENQCGIGQFADLRQEVTLKESGESFTC